MVPAPSRLNERGCYCFPSGSKGQLGTGPARGRATIDVVGVVETGPVICGQCGRSICESPHAAVEDRKPCPECGSVTRRIEAMVSETLIIRSEIALKYKRPGVKKPLSEQKHGDSLSTQLGRWMRRSRVID